MAKKQEQEDASPEITEVAPGILRLQLQINFTGLGHVNTYALEDDRGFALVDPGMPGEAPYKMLLERMAAAGVPEHRVHTVIVTHSHIDHFGGAGMLAERSGAELVANTRFRTWWDPDEVDEAELELAGATEVVDVDSRAGHAAHKRPSFNRPAPWGGTINPLSFRERLRIKRQWRKNAAWFRPPKPTKRLADADHIKLGGREWVALWTPGHSSDHLCLLDPANGVLLSGDHVLPTITPHVSGIYDDALSAYLRSLDKVAALEGVTDILPAHGHPFTDLPGRVAQIRDHHIERLQKLREIGDALGWASVTAFSHELFAQRSWGSMAEGETYAHLEHLRVNGEAERRETAGRAEYLIG